MSITDVTLGAVFTGREPNENAGINIANAGDVNGDGYTDLLIGTSHNKAYLLYGSENGFTDTIQLQDIENGHVAGAIISGGTDLYSVGTRLAGVGDVNGDGFDDILIGNPGRTNINVDSGVALLLYGSQAGLTGVITLSDVQAGLVDGAMFYSTQERDQIGYTVEAAGDVDGDGFADLLISAPEPYNSSVTSKVFLIYGSADALTGNIELGQQSTGPVRGAVFAGLTDVYRNGLTVSSMGDVNGDGRSDFMISTPGFEYAPYTVWDLGSAYLIYGTASNLQGYYDLSQENSLESVNHTLFVGQSYNDRLGRSIASAGDVNGDGFDDVLFSMGGSRYGSARRSTYLFYGSADGLGDSFRMSYLQPGDWDGAEFHETQNAQKLSAAGDVNGDGFDDFLIGAPSDTEPGLCYLIYGQEEHFSGLIELSGINTGELLGVKLQGDTTVGSAFGMAGDAFGSVAAAVGDLNHDGYDDLLVADPMYDVVGKRSGKVYLINGSDFQTLCGHLWYDFDADGVESAHETDAANIVVALLDENGQTIATRTTNEHGDYRFNTLATGNTYTVSIQTPLGYTLTAKAQGSNPELDSDVDPLTGKSDTITISPNQGATPIHAGLLSLSNRNAILGNLDLSDIYQDLQVGAVFNGADTNDHAGKIYSVGDLNADGYLDLTITAPYADTNGSDSGTAYLIYGSQELLHGEYELANILNDQLEAAVLLGADEDDRLGYASRGVGDVNGDGFDDLLISAVGASDGLGKVYLIYGSSEKLTGQIVIDQAINSQMIEGAIFAGSNNADDLGAIVNAVGDINGDGLNDMVITTSKFDHQVYAIFGREEIYEGTYHLASTTDLPMTTINGRIRSWWQSNVNSNDFNGDGFDDLVIVGVQDQYPSYQANGEVYLLYGSSEGWSSEINFDQPVPEIGMRLDAIDPDDVEYAIFQFAGDVNGDGADELLVSIPGQTYLIYGSQNTPPSIAIGTDITPIFTEDDDVYGAAVAVGTGDINGDGYDDLLISPADFDDDHKVYLIYGSSNRIEQEITVNSIEHGYKPGAIIDWHGYSYSLGSPITPLGDLNQDGFDDFSIGAPNANPNGTSSGAGFIIYGQGYRSISGHVWYDLNQDGLYSDHESAECPNMKVYLLDDQGNEVASRYVDDQGYYQFFGFESGEYAIRFDLPQGYTFAESHAGNINLDATGKTALMDFTDITNVYHVDAGLVALSGSGLSGEIDLTEIADGQLAGAIFNGIDGSTLYGPNHAGASISTAGDVNGDGYLDLLISAYDVTDTQGNTHDGQTYLLYGSDRDWYGTYDLADIITGEVHGAVFNGTSDGQRIGQAVSSSGDINDDGFDDILISITDTNLDGQTTELAYLVYGSADGLTGQILLSDIAAGTLAGIQFTDAATDVQQQTHVALAGDVNGDGFEDILVSTLPTTTTFENTGKTYLIYGQANAVTGLINLANIESSSITGAVFTTSQFDDRLGEMAVTAGDVNGDGYDDLMFSARQSNTNGEASGRAYLLYGQATHYQGTLNLEGVTDGTLNGLAIDGSEEDDYLGYTLAAAGDVNSDGIADMLIGQTLVDRDSWLTGTVYLIYGSLDLPSGQTQIKSLLNAPTKGMKILAAGYDNEATLAVSSAGDVNGDGYDDLLFGSAVSSYNSWSSSMSGSGLAYLLYGSDQLQGQVNLNMASDRQRINVAILHGISGRGDELGRDVAPIGDANQDGYDDFLISAQGSNVDAGQVYLLYGQPTQSISGTVWFDLNGDGIRDENEAGGADGFKVKLLDAQSNVVETFTTESDGRYLFTGMLTGEYAISIDLPLYIEFTLHTQTDQATYDNDIDPATKQTVVYHLTNGLHLKDIDAGLVAVPDSNVTGEVDLDAIPQGIVPGVEFIGDSWGVRAGTAVSIAGDVDGDGLTDFLINAPGQTDSGGKVYLVYGTGQTLNGQIDLGDILDGTIRGAILYSGTNNGNPGSKVSAAGDFNGDGFDDILIADIAGDSPYNGSDIHYDGNSGQTYLLYGSADGLVGLIDLDGVVDGRLDGALIYGQHYSYSGRSVASAGDVNADGFDDILIGCTSGNNNGSVYLIYGSASGLHGEIEIEDVFGQYAVHLIGNNRYAALGSSVSGVGDINADGFDDFAIGAPHADSSFSSSNDKGKVYLVYGSADMLPSGMYMDNYAAIFQGTFDNGQVGDSVAGLGDVNGDGFDDLLIGAGDITHGAYKNGGAYLIYGGSEQLVGTNRLDRINYGSLNGAVFYGNESYMNAGRSVSAAGDVNGDGLADLLIGSNSDKLTFLIYGSADYLTGEVNLSEAYNGSIPATVFNGSGYALSALGDMNQDGLDDLLLGDPDANDSGQTVVIYGRSFEAISGMVWYDLNENGVRDVTELTNAADVTVNLLDDQGQVVATQTTDAQGRYAFADLDLGQYQLAFELPADYQFAPMHVGDQSNMDSDVDPLTGRTQDIVLNAGQITTVIDAGMVKASRDRIDGVIDLDELFDGSLDGAAFDGADRDYNAGEKISGAGDVNGDGYDDLLIGVPLSDTFGTYAGLTYLIYGSSDGFTGRLKLSDIGKTIPGAVFTTAQLNEDATVYTDPTDTSSGTRSLGPSYDFLGDSVAIAGDINHDGYDDILIASRSVQIDGHSGAVYIVYGSEAGLSGMVSLADVTSGNIDAAVLVTDDSNALIDGAFYFDIAQAGDVNNDGLDDILIGAIPSSSASPGKTYLVYGSADHYNGLVNLSTLDRIATFEGIYNFDRAGSAVSSAGDVNDDGFDDILIGAYASDVNGYSSGQVYLVYGSKQDLFGNFMLEDLLTGELHGAAFNGAYTDHVVGIDLSNAGDVNGDGCDDFLIGAYGVNYGAGATYLIYGQQDTFAGEYELADMTNIVAFKGERSYDRVGNSVSSAGDVNGDGLADILIGAFYADPNGSTSGKTYLIYGQKQSFDVQTDLAAIALGTLNGAVFTGLASEDQLGDEVCLAGDVNGDGFSDLLISAPCNSSTGSNHGEIYLINGTTRSSDQMLDAIPIDPLNRQTWITGRILNEDDENWYTFTLLEDNELIFELKTSDVTLAITDGQQIITPTEGRYNLNAGTYYLRVTGDADTVYRFNPKPYQPPTQILAQNVFHNNTHWDGNDAAINDADDNAIDMSKVLLRPGQTPDQTNYTNVVNGITGLFIDVANLAEARDLSVYNDFEFQIGNQTDSDTWEQSPTPELYIRPGAGVNGSDRIVLIWKKDAISNQWLKVHMLANDTTGLSESEIFFFGNAIGDVTGDGHANIADVFSIWNHRSSLGYQVSENNAFDINQDGFVDLEDIFITWNHRTSAATTNNPGLNLRTESGTKKMSNIEALASTLSQQSTYANNVSTNILNMSLTKQDNRIKLYLVDESLDQSALKR